MLLAVLRQPPLQTSLLTPGGGKRASNGWGASGERRAGRITASAGDELRSGRFDPQPQFRDGGPRPPAIATGGDAIAPARLAKEASDAFGEWLIEDVAKALATNSASQRSSMSPSVNG
jgi:hypothetical protein